MKAYQVFKGYKNKHNHQEWDLVSTYLNKDKALEHCTKLVEIKILDEDEAIKEGGGKHNDTYKVWWIVNESPFGWDSTGCCKFEEIEITE